MVIGLSLLVALIVLAARQGATQVLAQVELPLALAGFTAFVLNRLTTAYRLHLLARAADVPVTYRQVLRIVLVSEFLGTFIPSSVGVDVLNVLSLSKHAGNRTAPTSFVVIDRLAGLFATASTGLVAVALLTIWPVFHVEPVWIRLLTVMFAAIALITGATLQPSVRALVLSVITRLPGHRIRSAMQEVYDAYYSLGRQGSVVGRVAAVAILSQVIATFGVYGLSLSLGLTVPLTFYLLVLPLMGIILLLPVSVGGLGVEEGALAYLVVSAGAPQEQGLALALLYRFAWTLMSVPGGLLYLAGGLWPKTPASLVDDRR
jgi:hypothetical protein